jgi:hypothetical protein
MLPWLWPGLATERTLAPNVRFPMQTLQFSQ